ncbi:MAG: MAPEG family protein, partial [Gammaproteobacteria bacterium]|nr:MAPEG family protein [Gammaproteobacteria bacterium]
VIFMVLSVRAILLRRASKVALGDGDQPALRRAVRAHANFAEYVPFALILLFFLEVQAIADSTIHLLCAALLIGRVLHAYGVSQPTEDYRFRVAGMILTLVAIGGAVMRLLMRAPHQLFG